ncbi:MAG: hypothetical protein IV107_16495 [Paucibacter sp.]|nr:hypothetical protein [Roseateles sp.]
MRPLPLAAFLSLLASPLAFADRYGLSERIEESGPMPEWAMPVMVIALVIWAVKRESDHSDELSRQASRHRNELAALRRRYTEQATKLQQLDAITQTYSDWSGGDLSDEELIEGIVTTMDAISEPEQAITTELKPAPAALPKAETLNQIDTENSAISTPLEAEGKAGMSPSKLAASPQPQLDPRGAITCPKCAHRFKRGQSHSRFIHLACPSCGCLFRCDSNGNLL